jgi:Tol biopolymer transport system component
MSLASGTRLGSCEVLAPLGAGGMGEVYRARDLKLQREVALKVLPDAVADDPERRQRFEREAHLLAALNHPHIAAIYGVVDDGRVSALMLELVPGETLAERLAHGAIPLAEALAIARQIADALDAAHSAGIVHRDLKPANIKLRPDGAVKVLDFGLAKAMSPSGSGIVGPELAASPTALPSGTQAGIILGTAAYMAPEQARGKAVDKRADIWAFGVVLWEMLAGQPLFQGETISDTLAAVLTREVDWSRLPQSTPPAIVALLKKCLERDPNRRLRDIGDAQLDEAALTARAALTPRDSPAPRWWMSALAAAAALGLGGFIGRATVTPAVTTPRHETRFTLSAADARSAALSPDGRAVVISSRGPLRVRDLGSTSLRDLSGTDGALKPFWSPDGQTIGFGRAGRLWRVNATGGTPVAICDLPDGFWDHDAGGAWLPDDTIVFTTGGSALMRVGAAGGDAVTYVPYTVPTEQHFHSVQPLPEGRGLIYVVHRQVGPDTLELFANGRRTVLLQTPGQLIHDPVYSTTGHILFNRTPANEGLWALPFALDRLETAGDPFLVEPGGGVASASATGAFAYVPRPEVRASRLRWLNSDGSPGDFVSEPGQFERFPALSPDGTRVAISERLDGAWGISVLDLSRGTRQRITTQGRPSSPSWLPDGRSLLFSAREPSTPNPRIYRAAVDGSRTDALTEGLRPAAIDAKRYFYDRLKSNDFDLFVAPFAAANDEAPFADGDVVSLGARPSPDGNLVAYMSMPSLAKGGPEIMLRRVASAADRWQISSGGGSWPRWSRDGRRIYYAGADAFFEVSMAVSSDTVSLSAPRRIATHQSPVTVTGPDGFDVAADGRLLVLELVEGADDRLVHVVLNWTPRRGGS